MGQSGDLLQNVMEKSFNKLLPIPKQPRRYRLPPPKKAYAWIPSGKLDHPGYRRRLEEFANEMKILDSEKAVDFQPSSRGWAYILENLNKITKDQFNVVSKAVVNCQKAGFLPFSFTSEDQDETRHFAGLIEVGEPSEVLDDLKDEVESFKHNLVSKTTNYFKDEKYYVMMCVEKGDIRKLFKPICDRYKVPIISSKGKLTLKVRKSIILTGRKQKELNKLRPVLLLFYDLDPEGWKMSARFEKLMSQLETLGYHKGEFIVERFGLNPDQVDNERYHLTWINNVKSGSGKEIYDPDYERIVGGHRKCESNAFVINPTTVNAAQEICKRAIEKYFGSDAIERFKRKEEEHKLNDGDQAKFDEFLQLLKSLKAKYARRKEEESEVLKGEEIYTFDVSKNGKYDYGHCPRCDRAFDYSSDTDIGKLVKCRGCYASIRIIKSQKETETETEATQPEQSAEAVKPVEERKSALEKRLKRRGLDDKRLRESLLNGLNYLDEREKD